LKPFARALALLPLAVALSAAAHSTEGADSTTPGWTFDAWIVTPLVVSGLLFIVGWTRLRARSHGDTKRWWRRAALFAGGWGVVAAALVSPLHAAGERSFAAHMLEHELLMLLGAPLLVLAEPLVVMLWALPSGVRRGAGALVRSGGVSRLWARASEPFTATALQAASLWLWHAPVLFDLALGSPAWHAAQHLSFLVSSLLFWTAMLHRSTRPTMTMSSRGVAALCLFATSIVSGALGALMAMSQSPWYAGYARLGMSPFGLTPVEDQQFAGLLMWIPGGLVHAIVALVLIRGVFVAEHALGRSTDAA
jgi:putative membrane protein